jgi:hypothetical protein
MKLQDGERIVVDTPARQRWRLAVIGLILTGASAAVAGTRLDGGLGLVAGILGLVIFGPLTVTLLLRALRRTPALVLDADGFTDHATASAAGYVAWQDVHSIDERLFMGREARSMTPSELPWRNRNGTGASSDSCAAGQGQGDGRVSL